MNRDLTQGSIIKNISYFALPYLLSYFLQVLYGIADLFIIGQFCGVDATTAVSNGSQIMHVLTVILVGLAMGSTVAIGRSVGANDKKRASREIGNTVFLFLGISIVLMVVLLITKGGIISALSVPSEAVEGTLDYLTICFIGIPFITLYNIISSVFRAMGDSKSPMIFVAIACGANVALDYLFIGAFNMGPAGAALGTTLSQLLSVIISLIMIKVRRMGLTLSRDSFAPDKKIIRAILKVGIPVALQDGFVQVTFLVITVIANSRGINDAAAVGVVEKLITFFFLVPSSLLSTVSVISAQNLGAGKPERAKKTLWWSVAIAFIYGLILAVIIQFTSESVVNLFTGSPAVILLGGQYLRGYIWDLPIAGGHFCFSGYFNACEHSGISFFHSIVSVLAGRIPLAYLASVKFADTLFPMGLATPAGSMISLVICLIAYAWLERHLKPRFYVIGKSD